jgi:lipopolysaccharide transport system ATP-binding protein
MTSRDDVVIRAEGLGKKYAIGHQAERERYVALRDVIARSARNLWRKTADMARGRANVGGDTVEEFWALKDVSFEVKRGEVLGIIGRNGAGKSTLLKILSRITEPSEGRVTIRGRVASLLEVGTGFHPELTGRENIYLNGAILGMTRVEIRRKFDEIVAFAEVEKFLDTPVKRYSSGMYVRLAFAVAAHLEPEILVVDEVLAVGDAEFQKKCLGKMSEVAGGGRTVLFVSHNLAAIEALCQSCVALRDGVVVDKGCPVDVVRAYLRSISTIGEVTDLRSYGGRRGRGLVQFARISLINPSGQIVDHGKVGESLILELEFSGVDLNCRPARVSIDFSTSLGAHLFVCDTGAANSGNLTVGSRSVIRCRIPRLPLSSGRYTIGLFLERASIIEDWLDGHVSLQVADGDFFGSGRNTPGGWEGRVVLVPHSWSIADGNQQAADDQPPVRDGATPVAAHEH